MAGEEVPLGWVRATAILLRGQQRLFELRGQSAGEPHEAAGDSSPAPLVGDESALIRRAA